MSYIHQVLPHAMHFLAEVGELPSEDPTNGFLSHLWTKLTLLGVGGASIWASWQTLLDLKDKSIPSDNKSKEITNDWVQAGIIAGIVSSASAIITFISSFITDSVSF